jgi:hypothetical protein
MEFTSTQIEQVARSLFGEPNRALSSKHELRFGTHGSLSVDLQKCLWFDHELGEGGDTFAMVKREIGDTDRGTFEWLERNGIKEPDNFSNGNGADIPYDASNDPFKGFQFKKGSGVAELRVVKTWPYVDEADNELFEVCRLEDQWRSSRESRRSGASRI